MANKWDWPWAAGGALPALGLSFLLGGLAGALMAALAGGEGARELSAYLSDYLILAGQEGAAARFWPLLWGRLRDLLIALILLIAMEDGCEDNYLMLAILAMLYFS